MDPKKLQKLKDEGKKTSPEKDREGNLMKQKSREDERTHGGGDRKKSKRKDHRDDT